MSSTETPPLFDSHCHLDDPTLPAPLQDLLAEATGAGLRAYLLPAVHPRDWPRCQSVAQHHPQIKLALGVHPFAVDALSNAELNEALDDLPARLSLSGAVAVGEIGLDFRTARGAEARARQVRAFVRQLDIAHRAGLPTSIHCVSAHGALLDALKGSAVWGEHPGVLHGYTGSPEMVRAYAKGGLYFGFGGVVTWPGARKPVEACRSVPSDRLLVETDAPYQAPHPHKGQPNRPAWLSLVVQKIAEIRGASRDEIAAHTWDNAHRLFGSA